MKLLITGGCGFIGSNFIRYILSKYEDARIVNLDKLTYCGNIENLKSCARDFRYSFVRGDICDEDLVNDLVSDADLEVQLAAITAMGQIGGSLAIRILEEMDGDPDFDHVQFAITEAQEEAYWLDNFDLALLDWDNDGENHRSLSV